MYGYEKNKGRCFGGSRNLFWAAVMVASAWPAGAETQAGADFVNLSLEELVNVEVTSVARRSQRLSDSPAAVFVITGDDIRRAGVTSIPEALRLAPGIEVARLDGNKWAISARGFNARFANKLLVLIDGRSVYTHLFSGVFWDEQDTMLEDVDRIEVIRGPGATLWGANAVNGVINVVTKRAQDTQGSLASVTVGSEERGRVALRHGATTDGGTAWRLYGKARAVDAGVDATGARASDDWRSMRVGFRADGRLGAAQTFTLQGDAFDNVLGERASTPTLVPPFASTASADGKSRGFNLNARLNTRHDDGESTLQAYYDRNVLDYTLLGDVRENFDLEYTRHQRLGAVQTLSWGLGYRFTRDRAESGGTRLRPAERTDHLYSGFLQDELALGDGVKLTVGSKFEHNSYTGLEIQPSVRGTWRATQGQTLWAAVSKAVRTPSRGESDADVDLVTVPNPFPVPPSVIQGRGNPAMRSERLLAWELGWRFSPARHWAVDVSTFYNEYDRLRSGDPGTPELPTAARPFIAIPLPAANAISGSTRGVEVVVEVRPSEQWRLHGSYSHLRYRLGVEPGSNDTSAVALYEGSSPRNQLILRSDWAIDSRTDIDVWAKYVGRLQAIGIPAYTSLNFRVAWRPSQRVEWSLVGQNLLDRAHPEFLPELVSLQATEAQRALFANLRVRF